MASSITRRTFIILGTAGVAGACAGGLRLCTRNRRITRFGEAALALVRNPAAVAPLGRAYLLTHPALRSEGALLDALFSNWEPVAPAEVGTRVRSAIENDFADARTVTIDGWTISETEAQMAALVALTATGRS